MQEEGTPKRVKLITDLTQYDSLLTVGQEGFTMPGVACSGKGRGGGFMAIKFDCGIMMDVLKKSFELI